LIAVAQCHVKDLHPIKINRKWSFAAIAVLHRLRSRPSLWPSSLNVDQATVTIRRRNRTSHWNRREGYEACNHEKRFSLASVVTKVFGQAPLDECTKENMNQNSLSAHEHPIQKIFSDDYVFRIPDYQRPYSWTTVQACELFDDLFDASSSSSAEVSDRPSYFLGSIVLVKPEGPDAGVIDGQQRLTTLTILLSAIRSTIPEQATRDQFTGYLYAKGNLLAGTKDRFRLTLRQRDAAFFRDYVQREDGFPKLIALETQLVDSRRNMRDNARLFKQRLANLGSEQRIQLAQFILQRCYLVVVATVDEDSAYRIFSVLNSRGLDLTATDILKAKIIGAIGEAERDDYNKKWEQAEDELGREDFNALFGHIRTIYRKTKAKETLLVELAKSVPALKVPDQFIDHVLLPHSEAYADVNRAQYAASSHAETINEHLRWLNRLEFSDWIPPMLAYIVRHRNAPERLSRFVEAIERLAYFMLAVRMNVNDRIDRFGRVTAAIEGNSEFADMSALDLTPFERHKFYAALDGPLYDELSVKACTTLLLRIDRFLADGVATYSAEHVTIEHVLPQTPDAQSQWVKDFSDVTVRQQWVHRLGNLLLLSRRKNSKASNWDFEKKKHAYFGMKANVSDKAVTTFALTSQVLLASEWTAESLAQRQTHLLATIEKQWHLEGRSADDDTPP